MAALHYNENSNRMQAVTKEGRPCYSIRFPKFKKGEYSVRKEKTSATYGNDTYCTHNETYNYEPFRKGFRNDGIVKMSFVISSLH